MSRVWDDMDSGIPAKREAEAWFARLMAPDCGADERAAFARWRDATPANARAYAATEQLWSRLEGLEHDEVIGPYAEAALVPDLVPMAEWVEAVRQTRPQASSRQRPRWKLPLALAACVLACAVGLRVLLPLWFVPEPRHYQTAGEPQVITLADGSQVQMDIFTRIEARIGRRARDVALLQGRAIFDVAHDATRPFAVDTGQGIVTALGTRFQIDREAGQLSVTLVEGAVSIGGRNSDSPVVTLKPGEQARYGPQRAQWIRRSVDAAAATSWSRGFHVFSATPLAQAVREINRYSTTKLRLQGASLESLVLSGNFKTGDAGNIASALPAILPVEVKKANGEIVVTHR